MQDKGSEGILLRFSPRKGLEDDHYGCSDKAPEHGSADVKGSGSAFGYVHRLDRRTVEPGPYFNERSCDEARKQEYCDSLVTLQEHMQQFRESYEADAAP